MSPRAATSPRERAALEGRPRSAGFTLVEVLVVVIVIGILAAVAIPHYLSQRQRAVDGSLKVDARTLATHLEAFWLEQGSYPAAGATPPEIGFAAPTVLLGSDTVTLSRDNTPRIFVGGPRELCVQVTNPRATDPAAGYVWQVDAGGLQPGGSTCAGYTTPVL